MKRMFLVLALCTLFAATPFADNLVKPASTIAFEGGNCTARLNRSASGIVNESNRVCKGQQNPWTSATVDVQFRPYNSTPDPACNQIGLVTQYNFANFDTGAIASYLPVGRMYHVCVYLVNAIVGTGSIDSTSPDGSSITNVPVTGQYGVCVSGTYYLIAGSAYEADAYYLTSDNWLNQGRYIWDWLGPNEGNVQINGQFPNWGAYRNTHVYCLTQQFSAGTSINLAVFDGYSDTNTKQVEWYSDNSGTLNYIVTFLHY